METHNDFQEQIGRIEGLVARLENSDPVTRATARQLVQCVMDLHGAGLARVIEILAEANASSGLTDSPARDPPGSRMLGLDPLPPEGFQTRCRPRLDHGRLPTASPA